MGKVQGRDVGSGVGGLRSLRQMGYTRPRMSSSSSATSLKPELLGEPRRLGRYEIVAKLASGGMATVYVGRATGAGGFERLVAIKCCHPHLRDDPEFRTMFLDEARLAAFIHHPNVVPTLDVQDGEILFLVMEYVEGGRVSELISAARRREEHVPLDVVLRVFGDTLHGLHAAHCQISPDGEPLHIIHRDISPQNLLVGVDGVTRVVDFGVAKAEARATVTTDQRLKGKLRYMSPEQVGAGGLSQRSDLFAAGAVLWEALTGDRLFQGDSPTQVAQQILFVPIRPPSTRREGIPPDLDAVVMRALSRDPEARYTSALEMAMALESASISPASHRRVGEHVSSILGERIQTQRALLREARRRTSTPMDLAAVDRREDGASSGVVPSGGTARRVRRIAAVLALLAAAGFASWLAWPRADPPPAPPPAPTAIAPASEQPSIQSVEGPAAVEPVPETAQPPQQDEADVAPAARKRPRWRRPPTKREPYRPSQI